MPENYKDINSLADIKIGTVLRYKTGDKIRFVYEVVEIDNNKITLGYFNSRRVKFEVVDFIEVSKSMEIMS